MKNPSKALVNNIQEFSFSQNEVEQLDIINNGDDNFHLLYKNTSIKAQALEKNFFNRTYSIRIELRLKKDKL